VTKTLDGSSKIPVGAKPFVVIRGKGAKSEAQMRATVQAVCTSLLLPFLTEDLPETWYQFYMSFNEVLRRSPFYGLQTRQKTCIAGCYATVNITLIALLFYNFIVTLCVLFVWLGATISLVWYLHYQVHQKLEKVVSYWRPALEDDLACSVDLVLIKHSWALFCLPAYESYLVIRQLATTDDSPEIEPVIV
jgi:hypothetical protein